MTGQSVFKKKSVISVIFTVNEKKRCLGLDEFLSLVPETMFGQMGSKPVLQSLLLLFLSKEVYSSSHTPTYITLPQPCWPLNPDVCHSRWWQSEMVLPTRGHSSDKHLSLPYCFFSSVSVSLSSSVAYVACCTVTHWPMTWLVSDRHQSSFLFQSDSYRTTYGLDMLKI